jgi:hypothetical protein
MVIYSGTTELGWDRLPPVGGDAYVVFDNRSRYARDVSPCIAYLLEPKITPSQVSANGWGYFWLFRRFPIQVLYRESSGNSVPYLYSNLTMIQIYVQEWTLSKLLLQRIVARLTRC